MITKAQIKKKLAESIQNSGIKQSEIAKALNVSQPTVAKYANGTTLPSLKTLAKLCKILKFDANEILCQNDSPFAPPSDIDP